MMLGSLWFAVFLGWLRRASAFPCKAIRRSWRTAKEDIGRCGEGINALVYTIYAHLYAFHAAVMVFLLCMHFPSER